MSKPNYNSVVYALAAYGCWAVFPVYFKCLLPTPPAEILAHRIVWALLLIVGLLLWQKRFNATLILLRNKQVVKSCALSALCLSINWMAYIYLVNTGQIIEASLGYFINPIVSLALGVMVLHERLRGGQWLAISLACLGVAYITFSYGRVPWLSMVVAITFGLYGLIKKRAPIAAIDGLFIETLVMVIPAIGYLLNLYIEHELVFGGDDNLLNTLLIFSGAVTVLPLMLFARAVVGISLSLLGLLQYIAPTGQFLIGVLFYGEAFPMSKQIGFGLIWLALFCYWLEGMFYQLRVNSK